MHHTAVSVAPVRDALYDHPNQRCPAQLARRNASIRSVCVVPAIRP